jgi:hypothetical protein
MGDLKYTAPYLSAFDCILNAEPAIYCSTELTSGLSVYQTLRKNNVHSIAELDTLDKNIYKDLKNTNMDAARAFASKVREQQTDCVMVINPGPLLISDWHQSEYLGFWYELIRTRIKEVHFNENWEFSNGCTGELAEALKADIVTLDSKGNHLPPDKAIEAVKAAVRKVEDWGLSEEPKAKTLRDNLGQLQLILEAKPKIIRTVLDPVSKQARKNSAKPSKSPTKQ